MILKGIIKKLEPNDEPDKFLLGTTDRYAKRDKAGRVWCQSDLEGLSENLTVECHGDYIGKTFICTSVIPTWVNETATIKYLTSNCKGIGQSTIAPIVRKYKENLFSMTKQGLEEQLKSDFPKLTEKKVITIINAIFCIDENLIKVKSFLEQYMDSKSIMSIYSVYKEDAIEIIKKSPYNICYSFGLDFKTADAIAYDVEMDYYDNIRIHGLIKWALICAARQGHTWVKPKVLIKHIDMTSRNSLYKAPISRVLVANELENSEDFITIGKTISLKSLFIAEKTIAKRLAEINDKKNDIEITDTDITEIENELQIKYGNDQKKSFGALKDGVSIITGGPGTGKTTTINGIIIKFMKEYPDATIVLCAPTGRAAKRMSESTGMKARTIHKTIGIQPDNADDEFSISYQFDEVDADLMIIDEFSMVSAALAGTLFKATSNKTQIIIVGDENQLPSIGAGNVLHDLITSGKFNVYRLEENFRQGNGGSIYENSKRILKGEIPELHDDFIMYRAKDDDDAYKALSALMEKYYDVNNPFKTQLIEPSRKGSAGTYAMNQFVHKKIIHNSLNNEISPAPMVKDKIIFKSNNKDADYVNGDMGVITYIDREEVCVQMDDGIKVYERSVLSDMELAYSYTIHKSQGSENPIIIIYLPETMSHMMTRRLFYTAVTRAKCLVVIVFTGNAITRCISNTSDIKRNTRLVEMLQ
jgi:exodeoxyribonuclease V alpha subunit